MCAVRLVMHIGTSEVVERLGDERIEQIAEWCGLDLTEYFDDGTDDDCGGDTTGTSAHAVGDEGAPATSAASAAYGPSFPDMSSSDEDQAQQKPQSYMVKCVRPTGSSKPYTSVHPPPHHRLSLAPPAGVVVCRMLALEAPQGLIHTMFDRPVFACSLQGRFGLHHR
jgi:hypothetical protein